jgi:hypothetical protein
VRAAELLRRAREHARERHAAALEAWGALRFPRGTTPAAADLDRAVDDFLVLDASAEGGPSALREFAEGAEDLRPEERAQVLRWEKERRRGVYLLERCQKECLEAWDPLEGRRQVLHFCEPMPPGRAAALRRGTVFTATAVPWNDRWLAQGQVEFFEGEEAVRLYRNEVRSIGRTWHDQPPPPPRTA